jgi:hypothetical protein
LQWDREDCHSALRRNRSNPRANDQFFWTATQGAREGQSFLGLSLRAAGAPLAVFVGYYFGAKIGFTLTFQPHPVSVLWPPNSILLAALLLTRKRTWWILLFAAFSAQLVSATAK